MQRLLVCERTCGRFGGNAALTKTNLGGESESVPKLTTGVDVLLTGLNNTGAGGLNFAANGRRGQLVSVNTAEQTYTVNLQRLQSLGVQQVTLESNENLLVLQKFAAGSSNTDAAVQYECFNREQASMRLVVNQLHDAAAKIKSSFEAFYVRYQKFRGTDTARGFLFGTPPPLKPHNELG